MGSEEITDSLNSLNLDEAKPLLFDPTEDKGWLRERFKDIPPYLFRITTPHSDGTTRASSSIDILSRDNKEAAESLNVHLR